MCVTNWYLPTFAAGLANVPFVAIPSNSHKIESLLEWSGLPIPMCTSVDELEPQIEHARRNLQLFNEFHHFLRSQRVLVEKDTASVLGQ